MKKYSIEICADSTESALQAQAGGAGRVELCAGIPEGGTTPSYGEILTARRLLDIRLHVIIRPRGGDFLYSPIEQEIMLYDIETVHRLGADGVVFGCLTADGDIDLPLMRRLMEAARGMSVTFHRAFDMCRDPYRAVEDIISLGCDRILTSGRQPTAEKGIPFLKELRRRVDGRIVIMPGCGISVHNIRRIAQETGCNEFHFSGRTTVESAMRYRNDSGISMGGMVRIEEYSRNRTDAQKVAQAIEALQKAGQPTTGMGRDTGIDGYGSPE